METIFLFIVQLDNALTNGHYSNEASDTSSKTGAPSGWINSLAGGGGVVAGVGGQSTISRKSGKKMFYFMVFKEFHSSYK